VLEEFQKSKTPGGTKIDLNYIKERDSPLKNIRKSDEEKNFYFQDVRPNIVHLPQSEGPKDDPILYIKHDNIMDRLKTLREKSHQIASKELINVLDSAFSLQEQVYHGVVPGDQYIKLPRIQYNSTERNPHLGHQRDEKGPVNVRAFRIPPLRERTDFLLRNAHQASMERAFGNGGVVTRNQGFDSSLSA
jgi:hypothetical protein